MNSPRSIALALSIAAVCLCVLCPVLLGVAYTLFQEIVYPASQPAPVVASVDTGEAEYYRGVYDTCVYIYTGTGSSDGEAVTACNGFVDRVEASSWFAVESKGYEK